MSTPTVFPFLSLPPELRRMVYQYLLDDAEASGDRVFCIRDSGSQPSRISTRKGLAYRRGPDGPSYCDLSPTKHVIWDRIELRALGFLGRAMHLILPEMLPFVWVQIAQSIQGDRAVAQSFLNDLFRLPEARYTRLNICTINICSPQETINAVTGTERSMDDIIPTKQLLIFLVRNLAQLRNLNVWVLSSPYHIGTRPATASWLLPGRYGLILAGILASLPLRISVNFSTYISRDGELLIAYAQSNSHFRGPDALAFAYLDRLNTAHENAHATRRIVHLLRENKLEQLDGEPSKALEAIEDGILQDTIGLRSLCID
ncbi:hypothetical protein D6D01_06246 [Aureobasidium pullulans]|uniref:Uncharacterized protein n=1 Tax=Aureobasidium pullulans TaxID=5580 RepID=A0A4S9L0Y8_AURPU|nr:hypothetical protein D6D01_06246 [Aureobasidium pullulans]